MLARRGYAREQIASRISGAVPVSSGAAAATFSQLRNTTFDEVVAELRVGQRGDALAVFQRITGKAPGISYHEIHRATRFINARQRIGVIRHKIGSNVGSPQGDGIASRKVG